MIWRICATQGPWTTSVYWSQKQECEDLLGIIRELTQSRNKLTSLKAVQAERLADLQHDFMRQGRVAELSRAVSKENINKTRELTQRLNQVGGACPWLSIRHASRLRSILASLQWAWCCPRGPARSACLVCIQVSLKRRDKFGAHEGVWDQ